MRSSFGAVAAILGIGLASGDSLPPNVLGAQQPPVAPAASTWTVARDPFVDLWFHSLAVVGYDGYGPLGLYDARYAARVREAKSRSHITTMLDRRGPELRRSLAADSAFEVLHFLPLYFVGQEPSLVLSALRAAVRETPGDQRMSSLTAAASVIAAALPTGHERDVFVGLLDAVDAEWTAFLRADRSSRATEDRRLVRDLQSAWDERFAHSLDRYLSTIGISRGTILISPAIGAEGRIVRDPSGGAIVAVSPDRGGGSGENAALLRVVRELAFPLLDQLRTPLANSTTRDAAAVRAGALILDCVDKSLAAQYRRLFLDAIGGRAFDAAYPISNDTATELRRIVTSAVIGAASGRTSYEN
ncbi:MAG: hypothetical protein ACM37U_03520 [Gemmatimonas sp.]